MSEKSTVYIVDDDPGARESLRWMLEQASFHVKAFPSAQEFLDSFDAEETGCLVLDVRMPEIDGLALQQKLRERKIRLPIIFMTAYGDVPTCAALSATERPIFWRSRSTTRCFCSTSSDSLPRKGSPGQQRGQWFRRPPEPTHSHRIRGFGFLNPGEEHQGDRTGQKGLGANHLAAPDEHFP